MSPSQNPPGLVPGSEDDIHGEHDNNDSFSAEEVIFANGDYEGSDGGSLKKRFLNCVAEIPFDPAEEVSM